MKLTELSLKLKQLNNYYSSGVNVLGKVNQQYFYIDCFHSYSFANKLFGYFVLSDNETTFKRLFSLSYEVQKICFLYQYYPTLQLMSPQLKKIERNDKPVIKELEISYNEKRNSIIFY